MGCHKNITATTFPRQSDRLNARVQVCFHYDTSMLVDGTVVRDDTEDPCELIIKLDDGRYLRASECQYSFSLLPPPKAAT
jgi:hypothetical protein